MRGKLAKDSEAQKGLKQLCVNVAGVEGKLSNLIRGGLQEILQKSAEAIVVDGVTPIQGA